MRWTRCSTNFVRVPFCVFIFVFCCVNLFNVLRKLELVQRSKKCEIQKTSLTGATASELVSLRNPDKLLELIGPADLDSYEQENLTLLSYVRTFHLTHPSTLPYTFDLEGPNGIVQVLWPVLRIVGKVRGKGFFVEAGAFDGVEASNTVWLERAHRWHGLLVECHPHVVPVLRQKHRKASIADVCLSKYSHPARAELTSVDGWHPSSSLYSNRKVFPKFAKSFTKFQVLTIPLYTLLAAISVTEVDFISLDVQGAEMDVLKHFPFHLILVKVWLIEVDLLSKVDQDELKRLMLRNKYSKPARLSGSDLLFLHESVKDKMFKETKLFYCAIFTC